MCANSCPVCAYLYIHQCKRVQVVAHTVLSGLKLILQKQANGKDLCATQQSDITHTHLSVRQLLLKLLLALSPQVTQQPLVGWQNI